MGSAADVLIALVLAGLLGAAGQTIRAIAGIKKLSDEARASGTRTADAFSPSRFFVSLIIGFVAGMVAALSLDITKLDFHSRDVLLGLAAAGYGGTDFLEAFGRNLAARAGVSSSAFGQIKKPAPAVVTRQPVVPPPAQPPAKLAAKGQGASRRGHGGRH